MFKTNFAIVHAAVCLDNYYLKERLEIAQQYLEYCFSSRLWGTIRLTVVNSPRSSRSAKENYEAQTDGRAHSADRRTPPRSCTHFNSERLQTRLLNWDINVSSTVCVRVSSVGNNAAMRSRRRRRRCAFDRDARRTHISLSPSLNPSPPLPIARALARTRMCKDRNLSRCHMSKKYMR